MPDPQTAAVAAQVAEAMIISADAVMTEEQVAEFRECFAEAVRDGRPQVIQPGSPLSDRIELAKINDILRAAGFAYPLGARGVQDLADGYRLRQEELHRLDPGHWTAVPEDANPRPPGMYGDSPLSGSREPEVTDCATRTRMEAAACHSPATLCPTPARPGHGTGCMCGARLIGRPCPQPREDGISCGCESPAE